jgi:hypothetical protein
MVVRRRGAVPGLTVGFPVVGEFAADRSDSGRCVSGLRLRLVPYGYDPLSHRASLRWWRSVEYGHVAIVGAVGIP